MTSERVKVSYMAVMQSNICRHVVGTSESSRCKLNRFEIASELDTAALVMSLTVFPGPRLRSNTSEVFNMASMAARSASVEATLSHCVSAVSCPLSSSSRELGMWGKANNNANRVMTHSVATIQIRLPSTGSGVYTMVLFQMDQQKKGFDPATVETFPYQT